jgi:hypothetical protein
MTMRGREGALATVLVALPVLAVAGLAGSAWAIPPAPTASGLGVTANPASGPAGTTVMVTFTSKDKRYCGTVSIFWNGPDGRLLKTVPEEQGSATVRVPAGAPAGVHRLIARNGCGTDGRTMFRVTAEAKPTAKPPPGAPAPPGHPSWSPVPLPSTSSPATLPRPPAVSAAAPNVRSPRPWPSVSAGGLSLDRDNIRPGDPLTATGTGCDPGALVTITSGDEQLGTAVADSTGSFIAPVVFGENHPGRRLITATCGAVLTSHVDLVVASSTGGTAATVVVLIFFLLVAAALLRGWTVLRPDR